MPKQKLDFISHLYVLADRIDNRELVSSLARNARIDDWDFVKEVLGSVIQSEADARGFDEEGLAFALDYLYALIPGQQYTIVNGVRLNGEED